MEVAVGATSGVTISESIVERACVKLRYAIADEAVARSNFAGDLPDMLEALEVIQPAMDKAEMRPLSEGPEQEWLMEVKKTAGMIVGMVEELQDTRSHAAATMTARMLLPPLATMKNDMATKVAETKKRVMKIHEYCHRFLTGNLCDITDPMEVVDAISSKIRDQRITGPVFEEALVLGRGPDRESIMAVLLPSAERNITKEHITILPIFGIAGSGKTTLAQMVFSNTHSLQVYHFRVWVNVSVELDFHAVGESIIRQISGTEGGQEEISHAFSDVEGMEHIMKHLHRLLSGKKVLLVLDDLWEEDPIQLQLLKSMLSTLGDKVDVIVTTCNQAIARKICTIEPYRLNPLSDDTCWEIIKKSIHFEKEDKEEELEKIGREMASKCRGLPSTARAYARVIGSSRHAREWKTAKEINIARYSSAFLTLELSYRSMPPDLRLCIVYYCEIFPNGHNILKDDLIHQWMALDHIRPSEILSATQIAEEYITRLLDLSFLQTVKLDNASGKNDKSEILFTVHHIAHELMRQVHAGRSIYWVATNHHGKLDVTHDDQLRALRCVGCSKVEFNEDSFSRKKCLRVLELKESSMLKLPDSICKLRHLRYLKISEFAGLVTLPQSFGDLNNLFHIDLLGCSGLQKLPESFGKLISLVHVNLSGCSGLAALPESFGDLFNLSHVNLSRCHGLIELPKPLQKLSKLVHLDLSFWSCFEGIGKSLGGLTSLEHLNLSHPCCHLPQHRSCLEGLKDGLCKLANLRYLNLSMCLNSIFYYHQSQEDSLQYIGSLSRLEHLDLSHNTFLFYLPKSLCDLNKLHTLDLSGCIRIKKIGETKSLKIIKDLNKCLGLERCQLVVGADEGAYSSSSNLAQLEVVDCKELEISCLERLKSLEEAQRVRLIQKQKVERLKLCWEVGEAGGSLKVEENDLLGELVPPNSLQFLEICGYGGVTCLPAWWIPSISSHLSNLVEVTMEDFPRCMVLPPLGLLPNLERLVLRNMVRITRIDAGELSGGYREAFSRLSKFTIDDMENLKEFKFVSIDELSIQKCPLLTFGPLPPRAQRLLISDCDQAMSSSGKIRGIDGMEGPSAPVAELVVESCNVPLGNDFYVPSLL
ncbi:unnamed protein product [Triticum turgidum subsp. durum]|uniref:NB-ARC domain-containing protein n=1 Tax=Triticum turgidum subsp. durum TaxID=4567 RepID=A0A9R1R1I7_TRITD|nr:unnamed protein product [Triticum turgidum subsp. durum]